MFLCLRDCHTTASNCHEVMKNLYSILVPFGLFFFGASVESFLPFEAQMMPFKAWIDLKEKTFASIPKRVDCINQIPLTSRKRNVLRVVRRICTLIPFSSEKVCFDMRWEEPKRNLRIFSSKLANSCNWKHVVMAKGKMVLKTSPC